MLSLIKGARAAQAGAGEGPRDDLAALAAAVVSHDADAVRTFVVATGGTVRAAVRMILGGERGDIEDVTQDAMIELLRALPRFRRECTVAQFAGRVAVLTAMAARRRRRVHERWVVRDQGAGEATSAGSDASPQVQAEAGRRREVVQRLLDELPEPIAETMALYFVLGHTAQEIAAMTRTPPGTIASRLRLGKERLRRRLATDAALLEELSAREGEP
jgi:RNA polymerase sigma factor (sigma-70 family)